MQSFCLSSVEALQVKLLDPNITIQEFLRKAVEPPNEQVKVLCSTLLSISERISASIVVRLDACRFGTHSSGKCTGLKICSIKEYIKG
jgi:hypothetical protein